MRIAVLLMPAPCRSLARQIDAGRKIGHNAVRFWGILQATLIIVIQKELHMTDEANCCCGGSCGCGGHADEPEQVYLTREEYIQRLEEYLEDLKAEIEAVNNELAELRQTAD